MPTPLFPFDLPSILPDLVPMSAKQRESGLLLRATTVMLSLALLTLSVHAQGQPSPVITAPQDVTFNLLANAPQQSLYQLEQTRRFRTPTNQMVSVNEELTVDGNGQGNSPFRLDFLSVVGAPLTSADSVKWSGTYQRFGSLFYEHGSFRVHDPVLAAQNYRIRVFGQGVRINRAIWRVVVFPLRLDKSIWLLDLDALTGIPLYTAEFDSSARVVSELVVTQFAAAAQVSRLPANWAWQPRMSVTALPLTADAVMQFPANTHVIRPATGALMSDYRRVRSHLTDNPFNGERSLVDTFCDGIDEFFVVQTPGRLDPFAGSPSLKLPGGKTSADTIAYYDDPSLRVYEFFQRGVSFQVAGRGSLTRLDGFVKQAYVQAYRQK